MTPEALAEAIGVDYIGSSKAYGDTIWWFKDPITRTTLVVQADDQAPSRTLNRKIRISRHRFHMARLKVQADNGDMTAMKEIWREESMEGKG